MVAFLVPDIGAYTWGCRVAYGKRAVAALPAAWCSAAEGALYPGCAFAFYLAHKRRHGTIGVELEQQVQVIGHAADFGEYAFVASDDSADVFEKAMLFVGGYPVTAVFCSEDEVDEKVGVGGWHVSALSRAAPQRMFCN